MKLNNIKETRARDIMTKNVVSVFPDTSLLEASEKLVRHELNGLPVVNKSRKVIGIITEYDLLTKGTALHLPTFIKLFSQLSRLGDKEYLVDEGLEKTLSFTVKDVMNSNPLLLPDTASISKVVDEFSQHHRVNPVPVVDVAGRLVGIISRFDIIRFYSDMLRKAEREYKKANHKR